MNYRAASAILFSIVIVAAATAAYALWSDSLRINTTVKTGELKFCIQSGPRQLIWTDHGPDANSFPPDFEPVDAPEMKDVGSIEITPLDTDGDGCVDTLSITMYNVYPWYYNHIGFKVQNKGTIPLKIWQMNLEGENYYEINERDIAVEGVYLDLDGDGLNDTLVWWGDNFGKQLHPGDSADLSLDITILQEAPQNSTLTFNITLTAVQWNEYTPGPIPPATTTTTEPTTTTTTTNSE